MNKDLLEFRIYNVGQANCSALILYKNESLKEYKVLFIFDCGKSNKKYNKSLNELINNIDDETVLVLSHPHYDHVSNFEIIKKAKRFAYSENAFEKYKNRFLNKITFAEILKSKITDDKYIENSKIITLNCLPSSKIDTEQSRNNLNSMSLVAKININNKKILIPGDRLYGNINESLYDKYDYILIPHHCCRYKNLVNVKNFTCERTIGFIQSGKNRYGHANYDHCNYYNNYAYFKSTSFYKNDKTKVANNVLKSNPKAKFKFNKDYVSVAFTNFFKKDL